MKHIILSFLMILGLNLVLAAQAYEGTAEYDKKKQQVFMIDYPYPPEAVENAVINKMGKLGYKSREEKGLFNKDKGYRNFKDAFITEISADKMDYIVKVESKGKKSEASVMYLIIMKEGNNMKTSFDAYQVDRVKAFLNSLQPDVEAENLELEIIAQKDAVNKAEKKLRGLKDDQSDLEKKLKNNQEDQRNTEKEIEAKKQALDALKGRRVNNKI